MILAAKYHFHIQHIYIGTAVSLFFSFFCFSIGTYLKNLFGFSIAIIMMDGDTYLKPTPSQLDTYGFIVPSTLFRVAPLHHFTYLSVLLLIRFITFIRFVTPLLPDQIFINNFLTLIYIPPYESQIGVINDAKGKNFPLCSS